MEWLFGKSTTPEGKIREQRRLIERSIRDLDREKTKQERSEGKIIADIKKAAKNNQISAARIMAKSLVQARQSVKKLYEMQFHLKAVALKIQNVTNQSVMSNVMKEVTVAMIRMNRQMNAQGVQKIMAEFQKQSMTMDINEELITDTLDDAWGDDEEMDADDVLNQVFDELGIDLGSELAQIPKTPQTVAAEPEEVLAVLEAADGPNSDQTLEERLRNLKT